MNPCGISVVIPCLNERQTIAQAVVEAMEGIRVTSLPGEVIVADNGSSDGSQLLARAAGARVVRVPTLGYGSALDQGFREAKFEFVVFGDADLSYPFQEIPKLIEPLLRGRSEFVLGTRLGGVIEPGAMPFLNRHLGTPVLSKLIRLLYGLPITDCNSGMRAFLQIKYAELLLQCSGMEFASEMLVRVAQLNLKFEEVPIRFRKDGRDHRPHLRRWRDGWRHLRFILGNAPSWLSMGIPFFTASLFNLSAFFLSLRPFWLPNEPIHYHTAFALIALSVPLLLCFLSSTLIQVAIGSHTSGVLRKILALSDTVVPFVMCCILLGFISIEIAGMLFSWYGVGFGHLSRLDSAIRLTVYTTLLSITFTLDTGISIIRLTSHKKESPSLSDPHENQGIAA